ncbi:MAG: FAD-binding oxidoreductase, partial [Gaiellaceae bacterium]
MDLLGLGLDENRVSTVESVLEQHGADLSYHEPHLPDAVVYPESADEVSAVLAYASEAGIPVVPFGAGTSLEGHVIPLRGGISLDLTRMNRVVAVRPADLTATVQAGVTRSQLEAAAGPHGLWFPVDPGADATLGGMAATNASGTTTVRYGGMRAHVLALEVVLADGRIVRTGSRAVKTSAGYNVTELFIGSEGTLGVITELTLRLRPIPDEIVVARAAFPSVEAACRAAAAIIGAGVLVTRCELLDAVTIGALNAYKGTTFPESPYLFVETSGDVDAVRELAEDEGATAFESERDPTARSRMWDARHNALHASLALAPGSKAMTTDVAVPFSELAGAMEHARTLLDASGLRGG